MHHEVQIGDKRDRFDVIFILQEFLPFLYHSFAIAVFDHFTPLHEEPKI